MAGDAPFSLWTGSARLVVLVLLRSRYTNTSVLPPVLQFLFCSTLYSTSANFSHIFISQNPDILHQSTMSAACTVTTSHNIWRNTAKGPSSSVKTGELSIPPDVLDPKWHRASVTTPSNFERDYSLCVFRESADDDFPKGHGLVVGYEILDVPVNDSTTGTDSFARYWGRKNSWNDGGCLNDREGKAALAYVERHISPLFKSHLIRPYQSSDQIQRSWEHLVADLDIVSSVVSLPSGLAITFDHQLVDKTN